MTNNKQQTALSFFLMGLIDLEIGKYFSNNQLIELHHLFNKAKEMEKEQHATTWDKSMDNLDARGGNIVRAWVDFDDYYEQTYGEL